MRIPAPGETDLLVPLHEGMFEQPMWRGFLARLRAEAGAEHAGLILRPPEGNGVIELSSGSEAPAPLRPLLSAAMREGRVYAREELAELVGGGAQAAGDGLEPASGLEHVRSVRVREPGGWSAWAVVAGGRPFGAAVGSLMTALAPHIRAAIRVLASLERERMRSSIGADAVRRLNFGWITIDARCRIVDLDEQAERVLQQSGRLGRGAYDRLTPAAPAIDRELTALAKQFAADPEQRPRAIRLSRDPWIDMLVAPLRVRAIVAGTAPVAMIYLSGDGSSTADRCEQLAELFGLTRGESRLAWSMARGLTIAEAAAETGLTVETARFYSKRIYAKTGARGQADLVRHILRSVLALA